jgi:hypothetical protein
VPTRNPARNLTPPYSYNPASNRYTDSRGRFVSGDVVRDALNTVIAASQERTKQLTQDLRDGYISLATWQKGMAQEIRVTQGIAHATAKGGWGQMTKSDWGKVGNEVKRQTKYLNNLAKDIETGKVPLDGRLSARADLYPQAARNTYSRTEGSSRKEAGLKEVKNILGDADHCDDCLEETAKGWQPLGEISEPGTRQCLARCKCYLTYR